MFRPLLVLTLIPLQSFAITNIEEKRRAADADGWQSSATVGLDAQSGNTKEREWNLGLNTSWQNAEHRAFGWYTRTYESVNDERTSDNTFAHLRYVHNFRATVGQETFLQYERDPFAELQYRFLAGAGVRFQKHWDDDQLIRQGVGAFHESIKEDNGSGNEEAQLTRLNLYTHGETPLGYSHILGTVYLQPSVDDIDDVRALARFKLRLPLASNTDLSWQWQTRWDSRPPEGAEELNHQTQLSVAVRF